MNELTITTTTEGTSHVLTLVGDLDIATIGELQDSVHRLSLRAGDQVVVDLAGVPFCDSSGISALLAARHRAMTHEATLALAGVPTHLIAILRVFGLLTVLPTFATVAAAMTARSGHQD